MVQMHKMPTYDKMLWPTLQALKNTDGSASNQELLPKVIQPVFVFGLGIKHLAGVTEVTSRQGLALHLLVTHIADDLVGLIFD